MMKKLLCILTSVAMAAALTPGVALAGERYRADGGAFLEAQALATADYSWFDGHESDTSYTLTTIGQLVAFANLVNGTAGRQATTFEGKTVALSPNATYNFSANEWTPIGDADHPFRGAFDGNGSAVDNYRVSGQDREAYLGFFGYVGIGGSVANLDAGKNAQVTATRNADSGVKLHHIAGLVGFCGGSISNCNNAARVAVESAVVQTTDMPQVIEAVGGVAGECVFDLSGCMNTGAITVSATSDPVGDVNDSGLVHFVGGVVGFLGDSTRVGTSEAAVPSDPAKHGSLSNCKNTAKISVDTPSEAGLDRFGLTAFARSMCVGGVVGYSQGSVTNCTNGMPLAGSVASDVGYIRSEHGTSVGGVVGSLRGLMDSDNPAQRAEQDDGIAGGGNDPLILTDCTNYGDVYALNAAGGIVGHAGTYTTIANCLNSEKKNPVGSRVRTWIVATRWNKPAPAGIVGSTSGNVCYCANFGTIVSGTWEDEAARTYKTAAGYYVAGIAGMLSFYEKVDKATMTTVRVSPLPEAYGCYNAGAILATSGMRQRGIVGENEGHVHHCVLLKDMVENDEVAYGGKESDTEANGRVTDCVVLTANELKSAKPLATLNASCSSQEWENGLYWTRPIGTSLDANYGYPVTSTSSAATTERTDISTGTATCTENARYNGGSGGMEATPTVRVNVGGVELERDIDYYVIPQPDAVELGDGYSATIVGIGDYKGRIENVSYGIGKGFLSECSISVEGALFNFEVQYPKPEAITVRSAGGTVIDPSEYEITSLADSKGNPTAEPTKKGNYTLTLKVRDDSAHFETSVNNTASGTYRISPADIMRDVDYSNVTITVDGKECKWISSSDEGDPAHPTTTFAYTGQPVKPTVSAITYNGRTLTEGTDYRIVYGNPNPENGDTTSHDTENVGKRGGSAIGCVTVRYVTGSNFNNYVNMFFNIVDENTTQPMYRLYNPNSGEHFYTADPAERDSVDAAGWNYEGVGWVAPVASNTPVYRVYNAYGGEHHYTTDASERDALVKAGWNDEGIGWYSDDAEGAPLYRQYNPNQYSCNHNYTTDKAENDFLVSVGWKYEGIGWYGVAQN